MSQRVGFNFIIPVRKWQLRLRTWADEDADSAGLWRPGLQGCSSGGPALAAAAEDRRRRRTGTRWQTSIGGRGGGGLALAPGDGPAAAAVWRWRRKTGTRSHGLGPAAAAVDQNQKPRIGSGGGSSGCVQVRCFAGVRVIFKSRVVGRGVVGWLGVCGKGSHPMAA